MFTHCHEAKSEQIFACEYVNSWEMIDFLMQVHSKQCIRFDLSIGPPYIPIANSLILLNDPPELFRNLFNYWILCVRNIDNNFFGFRFVSQFGNWDIFGTIIGINLIGSF